MTRKQESKDAAADAMIQELKKTIEALKYGTITIKVHNGKVAQIETTARRRFRVPLDFEKGDGI